MEDGVKLLQVHWRINEASCYANSKYSKLTLKLQKAALQIMLRLKACQSDQLKFGIGIFLKCCAQDWVSTKLQWKLQVCS